MPFLKVDDAIVAKFDGAPSTEQIQILIETHHPDAKDIQLIQTVEEARAEINGSRNHSLESGLEIKGIGELDTDSKSIQRISGATTLALLPVIVSQHKFNLSRAKAEEKKVLQAAWDSFKTPWVTRTGEQVMIGLDQLIVIAQELAKNETVHVVTARKAKDQLAKSDDPQAVVEGFHKALETEKAKLVKKDSINA